MTDATHAAAHDAPHGHAGGSHAAYYKKIWAILCVLLIISFVGPFLGIKVVTLLTAFGIAIVKAYLVAAKFMHLNIEKKYISMLMVVMLAAVTLFWFAVAPDIMNHEGQRWTNDAAAHPSKGGFAIPKEGHGHGHGAPAGAEHAAPAGGGEHH